MRYKLPGWEYKDFLWIYNRVQKYLFLWWDDVVSCSGMRSYHAIGHIADNHYILFPVAVFGRSATLMLFKSAAKGGKTVKTGSFPNLNN